MTTESKKAAPYKLPLESDEDGLVDGDGYRLVFDSGCAPVVMATLCHAANTLPAALALIAELREALIFARETSSNDFLGTGSDTKRAEREDLAWNSAIERALAKADKFLSEGATDA